MCFDGPSSQVVHARLLVSPEEKEELAVSSSVRNRAERPSTGPGND